MKTIIPSLLHFLLFTSCVHDSLNISPASKSLCSVAVLDENYSHYTRSDKANHIIATHHKQHRLKGSTPHTRTDIANQPAKTPTPPISTQSSLLLHQRLHSFHYSTASDHTKAGGRIGHSTLIEARLYLLAGTLDNEFPK